MQRFILSLVALATLAQTALAQGTPLNGQEFERYAEGRTIYYTFNGEPFGVEEYLPGKRVRWSFLDGQCKEGSWYQEGRFICFVYEDTPETPQCWTFFDEGSRLRALFLDDPTQTELFEVEDADEPMLCLGPDVGV